MVKKIAKKLLSNKQYRVIHALTISNILKVKKIRNFVEKYIYNPYTNLNFNQRTKKIFTSLMEFNENYDFKNKIVLELGPGGYLGNGVLLFNNGIKKYYYIDDVFHDIIDKRIMKSYQELNPKKELFLKNKINQKYIKKVIYDKNQNIKLPSNSVDFIFSNAVFEHVKNVEHTIKELSRICKTSGIMQHNIDLRDHVIDRKSLSFLKIPELIWKTFFNHTNRLRYSDFKKIFEKNGFEIVNDKIFTETKIKKKDKKLFKKYSKQDLEISSVTFILQKK